jgi:WD40 repeat protein
MTVHRAFWLATLGLILVPADGRADGEVQLVAGEPTVLKHPHINKSIGNPVHCLTFANGGASLATGAASGVLVWDVGSGELRHTLDVDERAVDALTLDPRGTLLVAGGASGIITVWDARTFKPLRTLGKTPGAVRGLSISPDGTLLASTSPNGQPAKADQQFGIMLWDLATGQQLRTIPHAPPAFGTTVLAFLPDGKQLVTAQDRTLRVIDVQKGEEIKAIELPDLPRTLGSIALRGDGRRLLTGAFEPQLRLWDTQSWKQVLAWDAHDREPPPRRGVASVSFSPDGRYVLSGGMDGMVCVWEATSGRRLLELDARGDESGRWITGVVMTPDSGLLAASHYGGTATIWRITEKK